MDLMHGALLFFALWLLYLASVTLDRVRQLSAQVAVLTLRVAEQGETIEALDTIIRTERHRGK
jgi:hypothetical protein